MGSILYVIDSWWLRGRGRFPDLCSGYPTEEDRKKGQKVHGVGERLGTVNKTRGKEIGEMTKKWDANT